MLNKKIVAILIAVLAASGLSAHRCHDEDGNPISCTGRVVEGTAGVVGDTARALNPFNWGSGRREAREAREDAADAREEAREARREAREARENAE